jgi:hypothetical protein
MQSPEAVHETEDNVGVSTVVFLPFDVSVHFFPPFLVTKMTASGVLRLFSFPTATQSLVE